MWLASEIDAWVGALPVRELKPLDDTGSAAPPVDELVAESAAKPHRRAYPNDFKKGVVS